MEAFRAQRQAEREAQKAQQQPAAKEEGGVGKTLMKGLLNAAEDTANFAIQNAGKF